MKVILLQDVRGIGRKGEVKEVKEGYARNFLIAKKLAQIATDQTLETAQKQKEAAEKHKGDLREALEKTAEKLANKNYHFYIEIGEKNEVFGSVSKKDIVDAIENSLNSIAPKFKKEIVNRIHIGNNRSIRMLGEHPIKISLGDGLKFDIIAVVNQLKQ